MVVNPTLTSPIIPQKFFYIVLRKDQVEGAGGVFIEVKKQFNVSEECELDTDAELIWAKIIIPNTRPLYVCSFYHPLDNNLDPILQLQLSLNKFVARSPNIPPILLLVDFKYCMVRWPWFTKS